MKPIIKFLPLLVAASCTPEIPSETIVKNTDCKPVMYIFLNDISLSNPWLRLDKQEIIDLMLKDSLCHSEIQLAGVLIQGKSLEQTPLLIPIIQPKIESGHGNIFTQSAIAQKNAFSVHLYRQLCKNAADSLVNYLAFPRTQMETDINGALVHARLLAEQAIYEKFNIRLIILSDLLNDTQDKKPLRSFVFPPHTIIYLIGKSEHIDKVKVFPENQVIELSSFKAQFITH